MDSRRFDRLTTRLSTRLSRRDALAAGATSLTAIGLSSHLHHLSAQDATPIASPVAEGNHPAFLFVQLADHGTWIPKPDEPGVFQLVLSGTGDQTLFFSDRPDRIVGTVPTDRFLDTLGFTPVNPPNAAVVVQTPDGEKDVLVVELFNPVYTRTFGDGGEEFLSYDARVLDAYQGEGLAEWVPQADDDQLPQEFSNVSLFIDDCADMEGCYLRVGDGTLTYAGPVPGGPYGRCYSWTELRCIPCSGQPNYYYDDLCRQIPACWLPDGDTACKTDTCAKAFC